MEKHPEADPIDDEGVLPDDFSNDERLLLRRHLRFYRSLETGKRAPVTDAQRRFVEVCHGRAVAANEHEMVYAKYMRLRSKLKAMAVQPKLGAPLRK